MLTSPVTFSQQVLSVLSPYPQWLSMIIEAVEQPLMERNYCPEVIEIFDQHGLLAGRVHGYLSYEFTRTNQEKSEFTAWLLDGELAVFYIGSEVIINRLQLLAVAFGELL